MSRPTRVEGEASARVIKVPVTTRESARARAAARARGIALAEWVREAIEEKLEGEREFSGQDLLSHDEE